MGGGKDSGGGGGDTTTTIRYAPYVEAHHQNLLGQYSSQAATAIAAGSPFESGLLTTPLSDDVYEAAFFSAGYALTDFPSLWDMFGKFMAGLDVDTLFTQIFDDTINNVAIDNRVSQHAEELSDDLEENAYPRFECGMRDMNSVISSSFINAKGMMEVQRQRTLSKYDATLRYSAMPLATDRWGKHLEWNKAVVSDYAELFKFYFTSKMDLDNTLLEQEAKHRLWPFTVLEYYRVAVGTMQGATNTSQDVAGASKTQKAIGGALSGAAAGALYGGMEGALLSNPVSAIVGGVVGLGLSLI